MTNKHIRSGGACYMYTILATTLFFSVKKDFLNKARLCGENHSRSELSFI